MNKQKWIVFIAVLSLVGAAAGVLGANKNKQRLGNPGLKIVQGPVEFEGDRRTNVVTLVTNTVPLPARVLDFTNSVLRVQQVELTNLPSDTIFARRRYSKESYPYPIDVSVVLMGRDRTSIHKPEICLPGQGWKIEKTESLTIPMSKPHTYDLPVMKLTASKVAADGTRGRALFIYWFVSESRLTADHRKRVWWSAKDLITDGVMQRWAYVACLSFCRPEHEEMTFARMKEFIAAAVPEFQLVSGPKQSIAAPPAAALLR
jgi:hypothetical protein